ncbi:hypothetical protein [Planctomicrobium sp. SH527]|uniref:hypothetical protein n=1 Tax=Planctomicrobium sp. SH527 TaxID=3448123 RepID=UPI003F5C5ECE
MRKQRLSKTIQCQHFTWKIFKRGSVYYADGRSGSRNLGKHTLNARTEEKAIQHLQKLDRDKARELGLVSEEQTNQVSDQNKDPITIQEGWEKFLGYCNRPAGLGGVSRNTNKKYRSVKDKHIAFCQNTGILTWQDFSKKQAENYGRWLEKNNYAPRTFYFELMLLVSIVKWLIGEHLLDAKLRFHLKLIKPVGTDTYCYEFAEVQRMLEHCQTTIAGRWIHPILMTLACTGNHADRFAVGLIGDTMQRIYTDGRADLAAIIPESWATPRLKMNHRSPVRVVQLINTIRSDSDTEQQKCRSDALPGSARLFLCPAETENPEAVERNVRARMAEITNDPAWLNTLHVKTLILEHQMAARRMNFAEIFEPLYRIEIFRTGLLNGNLPLLAFFTDLVQPLVNAGQQKDQFKLTALLRKHSALLSEEAFKTAGANQPDSLRQAKTAVHQLLELWSGDGDPTLAQVLECVHSHRLFSIPDALTPFVTPTEGDDDDEQEDGESQENEATAHLAAIRTCLQAPFSHVRAYHDYVTESATFDTHHGVKGREFDRVMVIINDAESKGFLFKYGSLLGTNSASTSRGRSQEVKESAEDRTRRLFYVTCSRSKDSLAVVAYTENPEVVKTHALNKQWFEPAEIELINP